MRNAARLGERRDAAWRTRVGVLFYRVSGKVDEHACRGYAGTTRFCQGL